MFQAKHCDLCEYPNRDLNVGLKCGLTNKKPDFKVTCPDIKFSDYLKIDLTDLLTEIEGITKNKIYEYMNFILLSTLGLVIIIGYNFDVNKILVLEFSYIKFNNMYIYLFINYLGMMCISMAFSRWHTHRRTLKNLHFIKNEINILLYSYNTDISELLKNKN